MEHLDLSLYLKFFIGLVAIINPLSGLEAAQGGLPIRPLRVSVPYQVMLIRPDHRPASAAVEPFCEALRAQAKAMQQALA